MKRIKICLIPRVRGVGGMVSFSHKMSAGLADRGIEITHDLNDRVLDAVLVIGGTRQLAQLWRVRRRGIPIVQRLNGMNWLHHIRNTGARHYLRAEYGNLILRLIRDYLVDRVVYQSEFARDWWEEAVGKTRVPSSVIYNGVDLFMFHPEGPQTLPKDRVRVLLVEGSIRGGYELGLDHALTFVIELAHRLETAHSHHHASQIELMVAGQIDEKVRMHIDHQRMNSPVKHKVVINWQGLITSDQVANINRSAHLFYSADINAACPNSVIEALACGTPVVAFDTGSLPELVAHGAGKVVPYGGDPWKLDRPDIFSLGNAALEILEHRKAYSQSARARAEAAFGLDQMVAGYLNILLG